MRKKLNLLTCTRFLRISQTSHAATWFEVLGTVLGAPSADVGKSKRIQARFKRALRIAMLPESVARKHADLRTFAVGSTVHGWITRSVPQGWVKRHNTKIWQSLGHFRYGLQPLNSIMAGAAFLR